MIYFLKLRRNALAFGEYWQKDMCMLWDPLKGCTANEKNCDECVSFQRIRAAILQTLRFIGFKQMPDHHLFQMCRSKKTAVSS